MCARSHIIVHHTGAEEKDAGQVRRYHLSLGWRDVGYNFIIERDGKLVPGRSLDGDGAHCVAGDMNKRGIGVALIGNLDLGPATPDQLQSLLALLQQLLARHGLGPEQVLGHREVPGAATACPGRYMDMIQLRRLLGAGATDAGPGDAGPGTAVASSGPGTLWRVQVGAFSSRQAAEARARKIQELGLEALVVEVKKD